MLRTCFGTTLQACPLLPTRLARKDLSLAQSGHDERCAWWEQASTGVGGVGGVAVMVSTCDVGPFVMPHMTTPSRALLPDPTPEEAQARPEHQNHLIEDSRRNS